MGASKSTTPELRDSTGTTMLANGDFERELAHWFFTAQRPQSPALACQEHGLNVLSDQGLVGLALLVALRFPWRYLAAEHGRCARDHALAPASPERSPVLPR